MQHAKEHWWIDIALMVRAEDDGTSRGHILAADDGIPDACQPQRQCDPPMPEHVEKVFRLERNRNQEPDGAGDENVGGNDDVGEDRSDNVHENGRLKL
jgi:hypothetical protein